MSVIYLFEDDLDIQDIFREYLETRNHQIFYGRTFRDAVDYIDLNYDPDYLITDWDLRDPNGNGGDILLYFELKRQLYPRTETILFSGLTRDRELQQKGIQPDHVFNKSDLVELLRFLDGE